MESEKQQESIFEKENYEGGMGSGPLAAAPEPQEEAEEMPDTDDEQREELDGDA